jgi:hypothetical protein
LTQMSSNLFPLDADVNWQVEVCSCCSVAFSETPSTKRHRRDALEIFLKPPGGRLPA